MHMSAVFLPVFLFASLVTPSILPPLYSPGLDPKHPPLPLTVKIVHQFPVGTWLENLILRDNGKILTTALSSPDIFQVDRHGKKPVKLVHTFGNATGCTGITTTGRDIFYVIAGNFSVSTMSAVPGSWSVYRVNVRHRHRHTTEPKPAKVSLVANFPDSTMLNGIKVLSKHKKWFLVSDSSAGIVYRLEAKTGKVVKVLEDPLMKPESPFPGKGVSGIQINSGQLYFINNNRNIFARMRIEEDGTSKDFAKVLAQVDGPNDFTFNGGDKTVVAQNGADSVGLVTKNYAVVKLAGDTPSGVNYTLLGPTSVHFGKMSGFGEDSSDWRRVYISTNGGTTQYVTGNVTVGGTISMIDLLGYAAPGGLSTVFWSLPRPAVRRK